MGRIVRVLTQGKTLEAIDREVGEAIGSGSRVLVQAARVAGSLPAKSDGDQGAVAAWAEAISQQHGLVWRRVGQDVFFTRSGEN